jgi:hypothetical protein
MWESPIYHLRDKKNREVTIDVTGSVSAGLPPNRTISEIVIPFLRDRKVDTILDFGAGALRHTIPLLEAGFQVCAVEFSENFLKPFCKKEREKAEKYPGFSALIWPKNFIKDKRKFDAVILYFVLQTMPIEKERNEVLKRIKQKMKYESYLFYSSRAGQITDEDKKYQILDGYYKSPNRKNHTFYTEFKTEVTHKMMRDIGLNRIRSLSERGTEQIFVYGKGNDLWIKLLAKWF